MMDVAPPPQELCDFCLPLGGRLKLLSDNIEGGSMVEEILYGHSLSKRSGRCFVFLLEGSAESGGKLFGVCVQIPRLLKTSVSILHSNTSAKSSDGSAAGDNNNNNICYDFQSSVCYAFITRFPLFDFFFQVIFDLVTVERLSRMEQIAMTGNMSSSDYEYIPRKLLDEVLHRLSLSHPPPCGGQLSFQVSHSIQPIVKTRPSGDTEYADWALPALFSWIPVVM